MGESISDCSKCFDLGVLTLQPFSAAQCGMQALSCACPPWAPAILLCQCHLCSARVWASALGSSGHGYEEVQPYRVPECFSFGAIMNIKRKNEVALDRYIHISIYICICMTTEESHLLSLTKSALHRCWGDILCTVQVTLRSCRTSLWKLPFFFVAWHTYIDQECPKSLGQHCNRTMKDASVWERKFVMTY